MFVYVYMYVYVYISYTIVFLHSILSFILSLSLLYSIYHFIYILYYAIIYLLSYTKGGENGKKLKIQIWDTAGQERFRTITTAYYRGAMGILLVYDVTDRNSFSNVKNWIRQIEQHASENVDLILVGNKCDADEDDSRKVSKEEGIELAAEYNIPFIETSAKSNINVDECFETIAVNIVNRLDGEAKEKEKEIVELSEGNMKTKRSCC